MNLNIVSNHCYMRNLKRFLILATIPLLSLSHSFGEVLTFCNPINISYQPFNKNARSAADPVVVPFKGKYYLFGSLYKGGTLGYWASEDLVKWKLIPFPDSILGEILNKDGEAYAPGLVAIDGFIYYARLDGSVAIRTSNPDNPDSWELFSKKAFAGFDPAYFLDDDGKLYNYSGALESNVVQLDKSNFSAMGKTRKQLTPKTKTAEVLSRQSYGLYWGKAEYESRFSDWNKPETLDTARLIPGNPPQKPQFNTVSTDSMQEAPWLTKFEGKYYLQNSNPGTACPWYSDSVWVSDSPTGPFEMPDYATVSMKVGGFINSAGHSCVFQDFHGNWWRASTMWIGVHAGFERRIGLFPVEFDKQGRMLTHTEFGDYPMFVPNSKRKKPGNFLMGWNLLSKDAKVEVSSTHSKFEAKNASDENVRTWWSAKTSDAGEWLSMDLARPCKIHAVQVNFAEQDIVQEALKEDYHAYRLYASKDGKSWNLIADKSENKESVAHDYLHLKKPIEARYLKLENVHSAKRGKFAVRDLRAFGFCDAPKPRKVSGAHAVRDKGDGKHIKFTWKPSEGARGYVIFYGVAPDALHLNVQYQNPQADSLTLSCFNAAAKNYYFRIDAYNEAGVSKSDVKKVR